MARLRVVTWNIAAARVPPGAGLDAVTRTLAALDADLVALQEVDRGHERSGHADQAAEVGAALGMAWWFAPALLFDGPAASTWHPADPGALTSEAGEYAPAYGLALLSRLPVAGVRSLPLPRGGREPRVAIAGTVVAGGERVALAATHLDNTPATAVAQLRHVQRRLVAEPAPRVLLGDLNLRPGLVALAGLRGWRRAPRARTFPSGRPDRQLDYVLASGPLWARGARVVGAPVSDHLAVVADLVT
jgi:endonuclease/exonuclease/phosphatase family metal-dependent hydrolase